MLNQPLCARIEVAAVQNSQVAEQADAFLFSFTHDVLQQPEAVAALVAMAEDGFGELP